MVIGRARTNTPQAIAPVATNFPAKKGELKCFRKKILKGAKKYKNCFKKDSKIFSLILFAELNFTFFYF